MRRGRKTVGCPVEVTLRVIEGRWKVMILHYLFVHRNQTIQCITSTIERRLASHAHGTVS